MEKSKRFLVPKNINEFSNKENQCSPQKSNAMNLMSDRRVFRGSMFAAKAHSPAPWPILDPLKAHETAEKAFQRHVELTQDEKAHKSLSKSLKKYQKQIKEASKIDRPGYQGSRNTSSRLNVPVQTETYLEEIFDRPEESAQECQTEALPDRPSTPLFTPRKSGIDNETQILPGELFDFDTECQPIIESLLGKVLEQSLLEMLEEQELEELAAQKNAHLERKQIELVEVQRMDAIEERKHQEIEARLEEERQKSKNETKKRHNLATSIFSKKIVDSIIPAVMHDLEESGYFVDPIQKEIDVDFTPSLMSKIKLKYDEEKDIHDLAVEIINEACLEDYLEVSPQNEA